MNNTFLEKLAALRTMDEQFANEIDELIFQRNNWESSAAAFARNADFYRDLLDDCAHYLGSEVYTSDDGSMRTEPLRLKIPMLVGELAQELGRAIGREGNQQSI